MNKDWRLERLERETDLGGLRFRRKAYTAPSAVWDHDHCEACSARMAEPGSPYTDALHEGFTTCKEAPFGADYNWVCVTCFELFREAMRWSDADRNI